MARMTSTVQRTIKQRKPFRSLGHEGSVALLKIADLLQRRLAAVVAPEGITPQQYNVLRILRGAGAAGLPTLEIAARMIERAPGITGLIDRLAAKGLVSRERAAEDRRTVVVRITPAGSQLLKRLDRPMDAADAGAFATLARKDQAALVALLNRVLTGLT